MRAAQMRGRGAPPGLIETLFNHSRTSSDRKCLPLGHRLRHAASQHCAAKKFLNEVVITSLTISITKSRTERGSESHFTCAIYYLELAKAVGVVVTLTAGEEPLSFSSAPSLSSRPPLFLPRRSFFSCFVRRFCSLLAFSFFRFVRTPLPPKGRVHF